MNALLMIGWVAIIAISLQGGIIALKKAGLL